MKVKLNQNGKEREIKEIELTIGNTTLCITEHQFGILLEQPHVDIVTENGTHSMDFDVFAKRAIN